MSSVNKKKNKLNKEDNLFLKMPLAIVLLVSIAGVLIALIFINPLAYEDACAAVGSGFAENAQLFTGKMNEEETAGNTDDADIEETDVTDMEESGTESGGLTGQETEAGEAEDAGSADEIADETDETAEAADETAEVTETTEAEEDENVYDVPYVPYVEYTPEEIDSRYFKDLGRIPKSMTAEYMTVDDDYFADSCWIGDSRTVGIADYCGWPDADFYCDNGFCAYEYSIGEQVHLQGKGEKRTIDEAMDLRQYGKVYIMIGVNDTGYGTTETFKQNYSDLLNMIEEKQPNAVIYIVGNMHISEEADAKAKNGVLTNLNINAKNVAASELADGIRTFYIDFNEFFTDDNGFLIADKTFDGYHLYADGYMELISFFKEHAVSPPAQDMELRYSEDALSPVVGEVDNND